MIPPARFLPGLLASAMLMGCAAAPLAPPAGVDRFSGEVAMGRLERLLGVPRAPGAAGRGESVEVLVAMMGAAGLTGIERLEQVGVDPVSGRTWPLTSLVGWVRPGATRVFVLATHFDAPPRAHEDPDPARREQPGPGASDGTSGVAVLLTLAPLLRAQLPEDVGFAVILFDGEEVGAPGRGGYCVGSKDVRDRLRRGELPQLQRAELGVVVDMVGDVDLGLPRDPASLRMHPALVEHLWDTARELRASAFSPRRGPAVLDDHVYLGEAGVPSVLLIDYEDPQWHTHADDRDNVSATSLEQVGEVLRVGLVRWFSMGPARG